MEVAENLPREVMAENFLNLGRPLHLQVHEAYRSPNKLNLNRASPRHCNKTIKNQRKRILKAARDKKLVTYKGTSIR